MKYRFPLFFATALLWTLNTSAGIVLNANDSGPDSLRQAIIGANSGDTITFAGGLNGATILLTSGQMVIDRNLDIDASALSGGITIDGNANGRIFEIAANTTNVFDSLTVINGGGLVSYGGAIYINSGAKLTLNNASLSGNSASYGGGIHNRGILTLNSSTLSGNTSDYSAGGINNSLGTVTLNHSTLSGNTVQSSGGGGGINNNSGTVTLNSSTLSGNSTDDGDGGGVYNSYGSVTLNSSTLSGNSADGGGGGVYNGSGTVTLNSSTLSGNSVNTLTSKNTFGGGICNYSGTLTLNSCTLSGNSAAAYYDNAYGGGVYNESGAFSSTNSIIAGNTAPTGLNIFGPIASNVGSLTSGDPHLAPLGDYGGPTQSMVPLPGSPALDAGVPTTLTSDQRGFARVYGSAVDIGAVELGMADLYLVVTTSSDNGVGSLRQRIARALPAGTTIIFDASLDGATILLTSGQIMLDKDITIDASALTSGVIIDGNGLITSNRIFEIAANTTIVFDSLTLTHGAARGNFVTGSGGAILVNGSASLTLNRSILSDNSAYSNDGGGAIYNNNGTITLNNSTLSGNSAEYGGGIYCDNGTVTLNNCTLSGNSVNERGGGIFNIGQALSLNNSTVLGNSANNSGGGVFNLFGQLKITNSIIAGNNAPTDANIDGSPTSIIGSLTSGDPQLEPLGNYGGPTPTMPPKAGSPAIDAGSTVSTNSLTDQRGLARVFNGTVDIGAVEVGSPIPAYFVNTAIDGNDGPATNKVSLRDAIAYAPSGSTIVFAPALSGQTIQLTNGQLYLNKDINIDASALTGGLIIGGNANGRIIEIAANTTGIFDSLTLINGLITGSGGAIWVNVGANLTLNRSTLAGNTASFSGGAIENRGILTLNHSTLADNSATYGGGIFNQIGTLTLNNSTLTDHSADYGSGIYNYAGTITLNSATLAGNSANNIGGGIYNQNGELNSINSIIAGNTAPASTNIFGPLTSNVGSLISGNPLLASLGFYGGPTQSMPPMPGSPAIDAGGTTPLTTDQRGLARVYGSAVDIGAVEIRMEDFYPLVTSLSDNGAGSLRRLANETLPGTTVTFDANLDGATVLLTSGQITVDRNFNIDASALTGGIMIDGNANDRIFEIAANTTNVFDSLTLVNGLTAVSGGAIWINPGADFTLNRSTITGNSSGSNGGGIGSDGGTVTLNRSTIAGNFANWGGGLYQLGGRVLLNSSTLADNSANYGGGTLSSGGILSFSSSTLTGNSANFDGGGIYTFSGNTLNTTNSIMAGNTAPTNPNLNASIASNVGSLISGDPLLEPLGNYGGPTPTMPPKSGSPAIDAGSTASTNSPTDQRGLTRVFNGTVDIGAVEAGSPIPAYLVNTAIDENDGPATNKLSLRDALAYAPSGSTIVFAPALSGQTIQLTNGQLALNKGIHIDASALTGGLIIDGNANSRIFEIINGTTCIFDSLTLTNGLATGPFPANTGGAILINAGTDLTLNRSTLVGNSATYGAGIFNQIGTLTLNNSTLTDHSADYGSGIYNYAGTITLNNATVAGNSANNIGGGIYNQNGALTLINSIIAGNIAPASTNIFGPITSNVGSLISGNPLLAPLAFYGGPTQTMPPLPGSPAIDAGGTTALATDQRGSTRVVNGTLDIGAVEYQGDSDLNLLGPANLALIWAIDSDGDGNAFGVEFALGTDWSTADGANSANLSALSSGGAAFGFNPLATNDTAWILKRSLNLVSDPFVEVYRYDGPTDTTTTNIPVSVNRTASGIEVQDLSGATNAFYQFEAEVSP